MDKPGYKKALQEPMRKMAGVLQNERVRRAFYDRAFFNAGEVDYLSIFGDDDTWHISPAVDVLDMLVGCGIENSHARHAGQFSDQKVLVKAGIKNLGEIEIRNDSYKHYRELKFRINGHMTLKMLRARHRTNHKNTAMNQNPVFIYGKAQNTFKTDDRNNKRWGGKPTSCCSLARLVVILPCEAFCQSASKEDHYWSKNHAKDHETA